MNLLFKISVIYVPAFLKKKELMNLFRLTASAFECEIPSTAGLPFEECLMQFAQFTKAEVELIISRKKDLRFIEERLFRGAFEFGNKFRKRFRVSTIHDAMAAGRLLYCMLGIDFHGTDRGIITITKCFFSTTYSPATCRVISSIDRGILAGLSGGGTMVFSERMTEGFGSCRAQIIPQEQLP
jgi:hypothetical protein